MRALLTWEARFKTIWESLREFKAIPIAFNSIPHKSIPLFSISSPKWETNEFIIPNTFPASPSSFEATLGLKLGYFDLPCFSRALIISLKMTGAPIYGIFDKCNRILSLAIWHLILLFPPTIFWMISVIKELSDIKRSNELSSLTNLPKANCKSLIDYKYISASESLRYDLRTLLIFYHISLAFS